MPGEGRHAALLAHSSLSLPRATRRDGLSLQRATRRDSLSLLRATGRAPWKDILVPLSAVKALCTGPRVLSQAPPRCALYSGFLTQPSRSGALCLGSLPAGTESPFHEQRSELYDKMEADFNKKGAGFLFGGETSQSLKVGPPLAVGSICWP